MNNIIVRIRHLLASLPEGQEVVTLNQVVDEAMLEVAREHALRDPPVPGRPVSEEIIQWMAKSCDMMCSNGARIGRGWSAKEYETATPTESRAHKALMDYRLLLEIERLGE